MNVPDNLNFLKNYQSVYLENKNDPLGVAEKQRKCMSQLFNASCKLLGNASTCHLMEESLKTYLEQQSRLDILDGRVKDILSSKVPAPKFKSTLDKIDIKSLIKPLACSQNKEFSCKKSEDPTGSEYVEYQEAFKRRDELREKETKPVKAQSCGSKDKWKIKQDRCIDVRYPESSKENRYKSDQVVAPKSYTNCFKTARDELQAQNANKYGNNNNGTQNNSNPSVAMAQKRKLGTRRNINSKFISPLLSNNDSNEEMKSEEWPSDVDERLKNIEPKMVELIKSEIMDCGPTINWTDIAGLQFAKTAIQEAVVWPMLRPDIFTGLRRPPKGILLFGPPGTGKTLIGKCVASQSKSTFFSISASSLTSKWVGDGEKMVRALFCVARVHQPSVIFIDEIDSLLSQRSDTEHESSRRIKTEFLIQLDGATTDNEERILVIGATNRPQELDEAARRRFVKRLYIPLPEYEARLQLVQKLISSERHMLNIDNFKTVAEKSAGYSGADIRNLCSEASLGPIRSIDMSMIERIHAAEVRPLLMEDFEKAFLRVRSSVAQKDLEQYHEWDKTYGSGCGL